MTTAVPAPLECLDLAIGAQEQFVDSKRPR